MHQSIYPHWLESVFLHSYAIHVCHGQRMGIEPMQPKTLPEKAQSIIETE